MEGPLFPRPELKLDRTPDLDQQGIQKLFLNKSFQYAHPHYPSFECIDNNPSLATNFLGDGHIQSQIAYLVWWLKSSSLS